jgi:hypothetical protein
MGSIPVSAVNRSDQSFPGHLEVGTGAGTVLLHCTFSFLTDPVKKFVLFTSTIPAHLQAQEEPDLAFP